MMRVERCAVRARRPSRKYTHGVRQRPPRNGAITNFVQLATAGVANCYEISCASSPQASDSSAMVMRSLRVMVSIWRCTAARSKAAASIAA